MKKTILTILGTILLGAIGSGIWDWILSDALTYAGNAVLRLFSMAFSGYLNMLYKEVGKGPMYPMVSSLFTMFFMLIIIFPAAGVMLASKKIKKIGKEKCEKDGNGKSVDEEIEKATKYFKYRLLPVFGMLVVTVTLQVWQVSYTNSASSFIERSIDILSPNLSAAERMLLISEYRSISNADNFYKIENRLKELALKNSMKLPEFSSI